MRKRVSPVTFNLSLGSHIALLAPQPARGRLFTLTAEETHRVTTSSGEIKTVRKRRGKRTY